MRQFERRQIGLLLIVERLPGGLLRVAKCLPLGPLRDVKGLRRRPLLCIERLVCLRECGVGAFGCGGLAGVA